MRRIDLPFSAEMARAVTEGRKCCTSRREPKGAPGDTFNIGGLWFRILDVQTLPIHKIVTMFFRIEGFDGIEDCAAALQRLYPDLSQFDELTAHIFARCP